MTDKPNPEMVPKVEFPLETPFTVQVTPQLFPQPPVTEAVMGKVPLTDKVWVRLAGVVMATATGGAVMVTATEAETAELATLVAVILKVAGDGTATGAV